MAHPLTSHPAAPGRATFQKFNSNRNSGFKTGDIWNIIRFEREKTSNWMNMKCHCKILCIPFRFFKTGLGRKVVFLLLSWLIWSPLLPMLLLIWSLCYQLKANFQRLPRVPSVKVSLQSFVHFVHFRKVSCRLKWNWGALAFCTEVHSDTVMQSFSKWPHCNVIHTDLLQ